MTATHAGGLGDFQTLGQKDRLGISLAEGLELLQLFEEPFVDGGGGELRIHPDAGDEIFLGKPSLDSLVEPTPERLFALCGECESRRLAVAAEFYEILLAVF